jgi:4-hydroxy-tetrahydrodipicolinate synthase
VKYGVSLLGHCTPEVRLPLMEATDGARDKVRAAMQGLGFKV